MRLLRRWVDTVLVLALAAAVVLLRRAMRLSAVHPDLRQPALLVAVPFRRWSLPVVHRAILLSLSLSLPCPSPFSAIRLASTTLSPSDHH